MKWVTKSLDEIADLCLGKMLDQKKNKGNLRPYLANINVRWGEFTFDNLREMRFEDHELERYGLKHGDIVMCEGGEPGRCAIWKNHIPGMMIQKAIHRIRPHECLDFRYLYYVFLHYGQTRQFAQLFTGSTIHHLPREKLALVEIAVPPISTQRKIAGILSAYDDLIENNTRRIAILEEMAQAIYREWFVQFHFPGHEKVKMVDSALGKIPAGWKLSPLPSLCRQLTDGTHDSPKATDEGFPLVTGKHLNNGFINFDECYLISKEDHDEVMRRCRPEEGDIIFSNIGTLGNTVLVDGNQEFSIKNVALFKPHDRAHSHYLYLYLSRKETLESMIRRASGTSQKFLSLVFLRNEPILYPDIQVLLRFDAVICPIVRQRFVLHKRNEILRKTRDLLLPKLISGHVDVEGLEIDVGESSLETNA